MTKQEMLKRRRIRLAIPAVVCLVAIAALALGTKVWQGASAGPRQSMELWGYWMGMRLAPTDSRSAEELGVPLGIKGVLVADVQPSSRALSAGLAPGDVVTRVDGKEIDSLTEMHTLSAKLDVNRQLQIDILRVGRPMAVILQPDAVATPVNGAGWYGVRSPATPAAGAMPSDGWGTGRSRWPSGP